MFSSETDIAKIQANVIQNIKAYHAAKRLAVVEFGSVGEENHDHTLLAPAAHPAQEMTATPLSLCPRLSRQLTRTRSPVLPPRKRIER